MRGCVIENFENGQIVKEIKRFKYTVVALLQNFKRYFNMSFQAAGQLKLASSTSHQST